MHTLRTDLRAYSTPPDVSFVVAYSSSTTLDLIKRVALRPSARSAHLWWIGEGTLCGVWGHTRLTVTRPQGDKSVQDLPLCNRCGRAMRKLQRHRVRDPDPRPTEMQDLFPHQIFGKLMSPPKYL